MHTPELLPGREPDIILLDYQCTLVANADGRKAWFARYGRGRPYSDWIRQEIYRAWLIPLIRRKHVILITARKVRYSKPTLARIYHVLDWLPHECYFNTEGLRPDVCKRRILHETVFPRHGTPDRACYLALESNAVTRAMYAREGISAVRVPDDTTWASLPAIPEV